MTWLTAGQRALLDTLCANHARGLVPAARSRLSATVRHDVKALRLRGLIDFKRFIPSESALADYRERNSEKETEDGRPARLARAPRRAVSDRPGRGAGGDRPDPLSKRDGDRAGEGAEPPLAEMGSEGGPERLGHRRLAAGELREADPAPRLRPARIELYARAVQGAATFLRGLSFSCKRADRDDPISGWHVSGFPGELTNEQLVELAVSRGMQAAPA